MKKDIPHGWMLEVLSALVEYCNENEIKECAKALSVANINVSAVLRTAVFSPTQPPSELTSESFNKREIVLHINKLHDLRT